MKKAEQLFERWLEARTLKDREIPAREFVGDGEDDETREVIVELEGLIASFKAIDGALPSPSRPVTPVSHRVPPALDGFTPSELLGEGGMGEVWAAEQKLPIKRQVALKVIKRGLDTEQVMRRFESERQALAAMDHPSIAKVFEAGATSDGRPYFVMERVAGTAITECCDRLGLSVDQRLELFVEVCRGVHHAHQKGVIHRDLKPSNVLVKEDGDTLQPKIIDFGIAKAITSDATPDLTLTELGQVMGTPAYMSPEQADFYQQDVDTRSDVYSLGVLLFELLVGVRPFSDRALPFPAQVESAPTPSSRLSAMGTRADAFAARRSARTAVLTRTLRGELDWIVLKALETDREKRYSSAADLAEDLGRYFRDEPVLAGPPGTAYHVKKFIRRHRISVGLGIVALLAIASALAGLTVGLERALEAESRARAEARLSQGVADFLAELFQRSSPVAELGAELSVRELLDLGTDRISSELEDQPLVRSRLLVTMGRAYGGLGQYGEATKLLEDAVSLRSQDQGPGSLEVAEALYELAEVQIAAGDYASAEEKSMAAFDIRKSRLPRLSLEYAGSATQLGNLRWRQGRFAEALEFQEDALVVNEEVLGPDHGDLARSLNNVAILRWEAGDLNGAQELMERGLALFKRDLGPNHPNVASNLNNLALVSEREQDFAGCIAYQRQALEIRRAIMEPGHPDIGESLNNLGTCLFSAGELEDAEETLRQAIVVRRAALGDSHSDIASSLGNLGRLFGSAGEYEKARPLLEQAHAMFLTELGPEHPYLAFPLSWLASVDFSTGQLERASQRYTECKTIRQRALGTFHPLILDCIKNQFPVLEELGRTEELRELEDLRAEILRRQQSAAEAASSDSTTPAD